jgi:hypothetical protein
VNVPEESDVAPAAPPVLLLAAARVRFAPARIDSEVAPVVEKVGFGEEELRRKLSMRSDGVPTVRTNPTSCAAPPPEDAP